MAHASGVSPPDRAGRAGGGRCHVPPRSGDLRLLAGTARDPRFSAYVTPTQYPGGIWFRWLPAPAGRSQLREAC